MLANRKVILGIIPGKGEPATSKASKSHFPGAFGETSKTLALKEKSSSFFTSGII